MRRFRPHHYCLYELTPGYVDAKGRTHHNSYGFRGPEFERKKRRGLFRVVCMGESTTYCMGIDRDQDTYPARLEFHLKKLALGMELEVLNAGVPGYTSAENLLHFIFKVQPLDPDLLIFYYTHNDVHPRRLPELSRDYREYCRIWGDTGWERLVDRIKNVAFKKGVSIYMKTRTYHEYAAKGLTRREHLQNNSPSFFRDNLKSLAFLAKGWRIKLFLVNPPYAFLEGDDYDLEGIHPGARAVQEHRLIVTEIAEETGMPLYDLKERLPYPPYTDKDHWHSEYHLDKVHVNEKGADVMAELIAGAVVQAGELAVD